MPLLTEIQSINITTSLFFLPFSFCCSYPFIFMIQSINYTTIHYNNTIKLEHTSYVVYICTCIFCMFIIQPIHYTIIHYKMYYSADI